MTTHCCLCGDELPYATIRDGQRIPQRWCNACRSAYDLELGLGWEGSEWARFLAADQRRHDRLEAAEGSFVRLDDCAALSTDAVAQPLPSLDETITYLWHEHGYGSRKLHRDLTIMGFSISRQTVARHLRRLKVS